MSLKLKLNQLRNLLTLKAAIENTIPQVRFNPEPVIKMRFMCFLGTIPKPQNSQYLAKTLSGLLFFRMQILVQF